MSKRGPEDEKTMMVGSGRKWQAADLSGKNAENDDKTTAVDQNAGGDKTTFVESVATRPPNPSDTEPLATRLRPDPSPRLSWPARDANFIGQDRQAAPGGQAAQPAEDERTRLYNPAARSQASAAAPASAPAAAGAQEATFDPVVGWLVVVDGHGKGRSIEIGIGANPIGREKGQKLCLDFGDQHISREKHAILVFDPRSSRFFLQSGDVRNLTYVNDELVLTPKELTGGETILVGETKLRFVALCGPQFGWS